MTEEKNKKTRSHRYNEDIKEETKVETTKKINKPKKEPKEHPILKKTLITLASIILIIILYSTFIGTKFIDIKEYKVESTTIPTSFHGLKIVHFSDLHYGSSIHIKELKKIVKMNCG